jgi:hypothetical protein
MNRRTLLRGLVGGVALVAAERTFPFRVYSFPSEIVAPPAVGADLTPEDARLVYDFDLTPEDFRLVYNYIRTWTMKHPGRGSLTFPCLPRKH